MWLTLDPEPALMHLQVSLGAVICGVPCRVVCELPVSHVEITPLIAAFDLVYHDQCLRPHVVIARLIAAFLDTLELWFLMIPFQMICAAFVQVVLEWKIISIREPGRSSLELHLLILAVRLPLMVDPCCLLALELRRSRVRMQHTTILEAQVSRFVHHL